MILQSFFKHRLDFYTRFESGLIIPIHTYITLHQSNLSKYYTEIKSIISFVRTIFNSNKSDPSIYADVRDTLVVLSVEPTHFDQLSPVIIKAQNFNLKCLFISTDPDQISIVQSKQLNVNHLFLHVKGRGFSVMEVFGFIVLWIKNSFSFYEKYHVSLGFLINKYARIFLVVEKLVSQLKTNNRTHLIVANDLTPWGRYMTTAFQLKGVSVSYMQHGNLYAEDLRNYHIANQFLVYGSYYKRILKSFDYHNITVTGAPYLDSEQILLYRKQKHKYDRILISLSGAGHSTSRYNFKEQLKCLEYLVQSYPKIEYSFRLHRKDSILNYQSILDRNNSNVKVYSSIDAGSFLEDIKRSDLVITGVSTTLLEAALYEKPVIILDPLQEYNKYPLLEYYNLNQVRSGEELFQKIINYYKQASNDWEVLPSDDFFGPLDGQAACRVLKSILRDS